MPVTSSIIPKDQKELNKKILATKPGQENIILEDVQSHLGKWGPASYQQIEKGFRDVTLTAAKCIVFLITGKFKVGGEAVTKGGEGHLVEDEGTIQLQSSTAVVIINQG